MIRRILILAVAAPLLSVAGCVYDQVLFYLPPELAALPCLAWLDGVI